MITALVASSGLAEMSAEESRQFSQDLALAASVPFVLWTVAYLVFLLVFLRNPLRRRQTTVRAALALFMLWASVGCLLLVPAMAFLTEVLAWL